MNSRPVQRTLWRPILYPKKTLRIPKLFKYCPLEFRNSYGFYEIAKATNKTSFYSTFKRHWPFLLEVLFRWVNCFKFVWCLLQINQWPTLFLTWFGFSAFTSFFYLPVTRNMKIVVNIDLFHVTAQIWFHCTYFESTWTSKGRTFSVLAYAPIPEVILFATALNFTGDVSRKRLVLPKRCWYVLSKQIRIRQKSTY